MPYPFLHPLGCPSIPFQTVRESFRLVLLPLPFQLRHVVQNEARGDGNLLLA